MSEEISKEETITEILKTNRGLLKANLNNFKNEDNIISQIPLIPNNYAELETPNINERLDNFIRTEIQRISLERNLGRSLPTNEDSFSSSTGLKATVCRNTSIGRLSAKGVQIASDDDMYTRIDFLPEGRFYKDPSKVTQSLADWINGLVELLGAVDKGEVKVTPIFIGDTNINMALIAQRFGFVIVDQCRTPDGLLDKDRSQFTVVGRIDQIRKHVEQFRQSPKHGRLQERAKRLLVTSR